MKILSREPRTVFSQRIGANTGGHPLFYNTRFQIDLSDLNRKI